MKKVILFILIVCYSLLGKTLTKEEAVSAALEKNRSLKMLEKDVKIAEAKYKQSLADMFLPDINISATFTYLDPDTVESGTVTMPGEMTVDMLMVTNYSFTGMPTGYSFVPVIGMGDGEESKNVWADNYSASLSVVKPVFLGFRLVNALKISKRSMETAKFKYEDKKRALSAQVKNDFYNLLLIQNRIEIMNDMDKATKERLDYIKANYENGFLSEDTYLSVQVQYQNMKPALLKISNAYSIALKAFASQVGCDNENILLEGSILEATNISLPSFESRETIVKRALLESASLRDLSSAVQTLSNTRAISMASKVPTITTGFNFKYDYKKYTYEEGDEVDEDKEREWKHSWNIFVQASVPIDDLLPFSKSHQVAKEVGYNIEKTALAFLEAKSGIEIQVHSLIDTILVSRKSISIQEENVSIATRSYELVNEKFKNGIASSLEVNDAQAALNDANMNFLQTIYDYYSSAIKLKAMLGEMP